MTLKQLQVRIHALNAKWWLDKNGVRLERNKGELICLMNSEVSEATEGVLTDAMDDKLPHYSMDAVEMADTRIRIIDYAEGFGHDLESANVTVHPAVQYFETYSPLEQHAIIQMHISKAMECERKGKPSPETAGWLRGALYFINFYCECYEYDLDAIIEEKLAFNTVREDHSYEARQRADGKKW